MKIELRYTIKWHFYAHDKFMRICQNRRLDRFMWFLCILEFYTLYVWCNRNFCGIFFLLHWQKRSKSLSPPILARLSPFSQTVNSRSWSTFYSEELSFGHMFEPLVPQICIHHIWQEQEENTKEISYGSVSSNLFLPHTFLSRVSDYIEPMVIFTTWVTFHSTKI